MRLVLPTKPKDTGCPKTNPGMIRAASAITLRCKKQHPPIMGFWVAFSEPVPVSTLGSGVFVVPAATMLHLALLAGLL